MPFEFVQAFVSLAAHLALHTIVCKLLELPIWIRHLNGVSFKRKHPICKDRCSILDRVAFITFFPTAFPALLFPVVS